jgi:DNA-directed RNA polymerase subunit RPC12/RpoP
MKEKEMKKEREYFEYTCPRCGYTAESKVFHRKLNPLVVILLVALILVPVWIVLSGNAADGTFPIFAVICVLGFWALAKYEDDTKARAHCPRCRKRF